MNSTQYRTILASLGLTQAGAAQLLGVDARTSRRWANDERDISETVARWLRFLVAAKIKPERVHELLDQPEEPAKAKKPRKPKNQQFNRPTS